MGYIREPKHVDLVVGPSIFTEATRQTIAQAIARYKKTGQKPMSVAISTQDLIKVATRVAGSKTKAGHAEPATRRRAKI